LLAWDYLYKLSREALAGYPTTVEEDINILAKDDAATYLGVNKRNCVMYRKSEK